MRFERCYYSKEKGVSVCLSQVYLKCLRIVRKIVQCCFCLLTLVFNCFQKLRGFTLFWVAFGRVGMCLSFVECVWLFWVVSRFWLFCIVWHCFSLSYLLLFRVVLGCFVAWTALFLQVVFGRFGWVRLRQIVLWCFQIVLVSFETAWGFFFSRIRCKTDSWVGLGCIFRDEVQVVLGPADVEVAQLLFWLFFWIKYLGRWGRLLFWDVQF